MIEPLLALGLAHQEHGEHALAIATVTRALQIKRANDGLYNLDQVPLLRQLVVSEVAIGDFASALAHERRIVELARLSPDDARSLPIFRAAADRQLAAYERSLDGNSVPRINIAIGPAGSGAPRGSFWGGPTFALWEARRNYMDAIGNILRTENYAHDELPDLEKALIGTYYLEMSANETPGYRAEALYQLGRQSYRRLVVYSAAKSGVVLDHVKALVELADWACSSRTTARRSTNTEKRTECSSPKECPVPRSGRSSPLRPR